MGDMYKCRECVCMGKMARRLGDCGVCGWGGYCITGP